jgi:PAS domain S-box-containing protein
LKHPDNQKESKYQLVDLLDISKISALLRSFTEATGLSASLLDLEGKIITQTDRQPICRIFHEKNPESEYPCRKKYRSLPDEFSDQGRFSMYKCQNGLIDIEVPLLVNNQKIGNLSIEQFLFNAPDKQFCRHLAKKNKIDESEYLQALPLVPVVPASDLRVKMDLLLKMTEVITELGLAKIQENEFLDTISHSEKIFRAIVEHSLTGIFIMDSEQFTYVNTQFAEIFGYSVEEVTHSLRPDDLFLMDNQSIFKSISGDNGQTSESMVHSIVQGAHKDGQTVFIELHGTHLILDDRVLFSGNVLDITEKVQADNLLKSQKKRIEIFRSIDLEILKANSVREIIESVLKSLRQIIPCNNAIVQQFDAQARFATQFVINSDFELQEISEIPLPRNEEFSKLQMGQTILLNDWDKIIDQLSPVARAYYNQGIRSAVIAPIMIEGNLYGTLGVSSVTPNNFNNDHREILEETSHLLAIAIRNELLKEQIQANARRLESAQRIGNIGTWEINIITGEVIWSDEQYRIHGLDPETFSPTRENVFELVHPDDLDGVMEKTREAIAHGNPINFEIRVLYSNKEVHTHLVHMEVQVNDKNEPIKLIGLTQDISEKKKAEYLLEKSTHRLQSQNEALLLLMSRGEWFSADFTVAIQEITRVSCKLIETGRVSVWCFQDHYSTVSSIDVFDRSKNMHSSGEKFHHNFFEKYTNLESANKLIIIEDIMDDPQIDALHLEYYKKHNVKALLSGPVWAGEKVWGILSFEETENVRSWSKEDERLMTSMATMISLAYEIKEKRVAQQELIRQRIHLEELVAQRTKDLESSNQELLDKNMELARFNDLFVNREFRIKELKDKIKELEAKDKL